MESVSTRSDSESCPAGERRINGVCRTDSSALPLNYAPGSYYDYQPGRLFLKTPPSASTSYGSHMGAWVQTFGDYEQRTETTGTTTPSLGGVAGTLLTPNPAGGPNQVLSLSSALGRTTGTGGVMGGFDVTMPFDSSVLLAGLLTGYTSTHVSFTNSVDTADMFGPTVGAYAAYVRGQFSVDGIVKADLLTLNQSFSDFSGTPFAVSGSSSIRLDNYSEAVNFNYRIPMGRWYLQPTAGTTYTQEVYGGDAAALGLADGTDWRLQAGARIGTNWMFGKLAVNSTLTGLVYDDAIITGGTINQGGFAGTIIPTDEGKLFGELLWASTADLGRGFSGVTAANVYFRTGVFGVGGQAGLRYQW
jgi:outer membrane autotransporter protein